MLGQAESFLHRPPRVSGDPFAGEVFTTAFTVATANNVAVLPTFAPTSGGCLVRFIPTTDCFIIFGRSGIGAVSSSTGFLWPANQEKTLWITFPDDAAFSIIRSTADGTLYRYRLTR